MDYSGYQIDVPMELDPTFDIDLDEIFNGENATLHQQAAELYPAFHQGDFASTNVFPGEEFQNFLPQNDVASYDLFQPGLQSNTFNEEDFPMTENFLQPQMDGPFRQDQMAFVNTLPQALFYDNISQEDFHGTGILQAGGNPYMPELLGSNEASNQINFQSYVQQADFTASLQNIEQPCIELVSVVNRSRGTEKKSGKGYSHDEWEAKKDILYRLWVEENRNMSLLIETMKTVHRFTASEGAYRPRFKQWGFPHKNRTKANAGAAIVSDDDKNSIRERAAQALPIQRSQKGGVTWAFVKDSVPKVLADKIYKHQGDMINHLEKLVKGLFDKGNKNAWKYDQFTLAPLSGAKDNSKTWQLLTHQCYSASTLAECGLSSRVTPSLQRLFEGLHQVGKICNPNVLIYFWNICASLNRLRLSGVSKTEEYQDHPLLCPLLAVLEKSFSSSRKSSERTHSMIDFLRSLRSIMKEDPRSMRKTLELGYKKVIDTIGEVLGHGHVVVLNMVSHYVKSYNAHIVVKKIDPETILGRYKYLIRAAENTADTSEEQKIALLYDYIRAMSLGQIDYNVVLILYRKTLGICKVQQRLKCCLATRAFAFSTELLANMHLEKETADTKALRKQQAQEEKKLISKNRGLVEKMALAEQQSPREAKEIANKKALTYKRALAEKKRLMREEAKKVAAEAKERAKGQKRAEIKEIAEMKVLSARRALAENKLPTEAKEIAKETANNLKSALAEQKEQEALAMRRELRIQGPELPPKMSHIFLSDAISILQDGDQDCLIWAASFSKRLSLWHRSSGDRLACRNEKDRTLRIRFRIEAIQPAKIASRKKQMDWLVRGSPGYVNGRRMQRHEAHRAVVSSLEVGMPDK